MIFGINTMSDISKLFYVISWAVRRVKFETILKYHEWYLCQKSCTNHAIICLYYYPQKVVIFTCRYFKLSWNTTALSQSNCRNFSCSSISPENPSKFDFFRLKSCEISRFFCEFWLFSRENPAKSADFSMNLPLKIPRNFAFFFAKYQKPCIKQNVT